MSSILKNLPREVLEKARSYQKIGVRLINKYDGCCLLADDMGLGKTLQVIMYLLLRPDLRPALIVVPASVKIKWGREFEKWAPDESVQIVEGRKPFNLEADIVIINWDVIHYSMIITRPEDGKTVKLRYAREELLKINFKIVIGDEIQFITNNKSGRTVAFKKITKNKNHIIGISGAPIEGKPIDFYNILKILRPSQFGDWLYYVKRYCDGKPGFFGWKKDGATNLEELHEKISNFTIRRKKEDVLKDLPKLQRIVIPLESNNRKEYLKAENNYRRWMIENGRDLKKASNAMWLTQISVLEGLAVEGILDSAIKWIEDYLKTSNKLVVGCFRRNVNNAIHKHFGKRSLQLIGGMSSTKKQESIDRFQNDESVELLSCNLKSANVGLDLFAANATCTIELMWNDVIHSEFEARVHRIGQEAPKVFAYYLVGLNTIMEKKAEYIDKKRTIANVILDGKKPYDEELLLKQLEEYENGQTN